MNEREVLCAYKLGQQTSATKQIPPAMYKLTYFEARGLAEPIRMIFALAGVKFDDIRLCDDDWEELKASK